MCANKKPKYAALQGSCARLKADLIIERDGPYIKHWCRMTSIVNEYITKRDLDHIREGRSTIYKFKNGVVKRLVLVDNKPKWKKAHMSPMYLS